MKAIVLVWILLGGLAASLGATSPPVDLMCEPLPVPDPRAKSQLGCSVNLHGNSLALGANLDGAGAITPCQKGPDGAWTCGSKLTPSDGRSGDEFGRSSAIDGEWLAVGAPFASGSGVVYIFHRNGEGSDWSQSSKITASDAKLGDQFGLTLALSGDTLIVGAPNQVGNAGSLSGAVYVFHQEGGTWSQGQKLAASDAAPFDNFGFSLAIEGTRIVVGAPFHDGAGSSSGEAYVFEWTGTTWSQAAKLTASDAAAGDEFGSAVAVSGDRLVVAARADDVAGKVDAGSAWVFERDDSGWPPVAHLLGEAAGDRFGAGVSISGDRLLIGALLHNGSGAESGAAYLFQRYPAATPHWQLNDPPLLGQAAGDRFGQAVSMDEKSVLVGAYLGDATDRDGNVLVDAGTVMVCPDKAIQIHKDDNLVTVRPGQTVTYTIQVRNTTSQAIPVVRVTDIFRNKLQGVLWCASQDGPDCTPSHPGDIDLPFALAPRYQARDGVKFIVKATVKLDARGQLTNQACAAIPGDPTSGVPTSQVCAEDPPDEIQTPCDADLRIVKTGPASARPGDRITYTLTVTNLGTCRATGVHVEDPIPADLLAVAPAPASGCAIEGGTKVVCGLPDLPVGQSHSVSLQYDVQETCDPAIVNAATVTANESDLVPTDNTSQFTTAIRRRAHLALTKTAPAMVNRGDPLPYVLTVTNLGPDIACGVTLSDPIPAGLGTPVVFPPCTATAGVVTCPIGTLAVTDPPRNFTVIFTAPATAPCASKIINTARVSAAPPSDPNPGNDVAMVMTAIKDDLSITKTDGLTTAAPGQVLLYTITVGNPGGCLAAVTDIVPTDLDMVRWCRDTSGPCVPTRTGDLHDVETDPTATYRVQGMVPPMFTGTVANTATVAGPPGFVDADPSNNSARDTTLVVLAPGVTVYCKGIAGPLNAGGAVTYTFLLLNGGPNAQMDNPGNEFSDLLPAGLTPVSASASSGVVVLANPVTWNGAIPVGGMVTITIAATIAPTALGQTFCNGPTIAFDRDGNGANESSGGVAFPCCFTAQPPNVPALSATALGLLALLLALVALRSMAQRRRSPAD